MFCTCNVRPVKICVITDDNVSRTIGYAAQLLAIGPGSYQGIVVKDGYMVVSTIQEKSGHGVPETHQPKVSSFAHAHVCMQLCVNYIDALSSYMAMPGFRLVLVVIRPS